MKKSNVNNYLFFGNHKFPRISVFGISVTLLLFHVYIRNKPVTSFSSLFFERFCLHQCLLLAVAWLRLSACRLVLSCLVSCCLRFLLVLDRVLSCLIYCLAMSCMFLSCFSIPFLNPLFCSYSSFSSSLLTYS